MKEIPPAGIERQTIQATRMRQALAITLQDIESGQNARNAINATGALITTLNEFEAATRDERERLLQNSNAPSNEESTLCEWYAKRYDQLARMARAITERPTDSISPVADYAGAWAYAILLRGHATKWRHAAGHRAIAPRGILHQVFKSAIAAGIGDRILPMVIEGQPTETTVESLYARTLLLERFASGNLSARRLEILDNWLVSWMGAMRLSCDRSTIGGGPMLCIDTNSETHGLMRAEAGKSADYFMALRPLQRQLAHAIQSFHRGVIFPGWGIGMAFRIEEHVGVIQILEHEFHMLAHSAGTKSKRVSVGHDAEVSVFVGTDHVSAACAAVEAPAYQLRVLDFSETGMGLISSAEIAQSIAVEDLVAVRLRTGEGVLLGTVVRKAVGLEHNTVVLGVSLLSKRPLRMTVSMATPHAGTITFDTIFLQGSSAEGNGDAMILSDATYRFNSTLTTGFGDEVFHVRPGRVRRHGRGWKLVSFDVSTE
jgi:hypothetical protein